MARALAVGLNNLHSLLIDLDTMQLRSGRSWRVCRQRTQGKSWFWSLVCCLRVSSFRHRKCIPLIPRTRQVMRMPIQTRAERSPVISLNTDEIIQTAELSDLGLPPTEDEGRFANWSATAISPTESPGIGTRWAGRVDMADVFFHSWFEMSNELKLRDTAGVSSNLPDASDPHLQLRHRPTTTGAADLIRGESIGSFSEITEIGFVRKLTPVQLPANMLLQIAPLDIEFSDDLDASVSDFRKVRLGTGQSFFRRYTEA